MPLFLDQIEKLRLPNQQMTITVHTIDTHEEPALMVGVASCRRAAMLRQYSVVDGDSSHTQRSFLSAECLWRHFQHIDDASRDAATWLKRHPETLFSNNQHVVRLGGVCISPLPLPMLFVLLLRYIPESL